MPPATRSSNPPLGTNGDQRRRLLCHHVPLGLASAVVLVLFMRLPLFDATRYLPGDIFSGPFPQQRGGDRTGPMRHGPMRHGGDRTGPMAHGGDRAGPMDHSPMAHGGDRTRPMGRRGDHARPIDPDEMEIMRSRAFSRQLTVGTGYVALGLLALTLLIGPANLLLRRRNPVSSYLRRDVGTWTAIFSLVHVIVGLQVHGRGRIADFLDYFVANGRPLLNSFGLGNWTGLGALVIVLGLLALSSDAALRTLTSGTWKALQRLNYALFALVILHAFFYGALLRIRSLFTLLLGSASSRSSSDRQSVSGCGGGRTRAHHRPYRVWPRNTPSPMVHR